MLKRYLPPVLLVLLAAAIAAHAQMPRTISYQGVLADASGTFLPDGNHVLVLALYDQPAGGTAMFTEMQTVTIVRGVFNAIIGSVTAGGIPASLSFDRAYFLGVQVDGGTELVPRTPLTAVPYAMRAAVATVAESFSGTATGIVTSINGASGGVQLVGGGTTSINRSGSQITISSSGAGGVGIQGVQNSDGSLEITNASGPVATIGIADFGVTAGELAAGAVTTTKLVDGGVSTAKLENGAVTAPKLSSEAVISRVIASGAVTEDKLADNAVITRVIKDSSITQSKLAAGLTMPPGGTAGGDLSGTYPDPTIAPGAVTQSKLSANAVGSNEIIDNSIAGGDISSSAALAVASLTTSGNAVINGNGTVVGNALIGTRTAGGARLAVRSSGVTAATSALSITDSLGTSLLHVRDDGHVGIGTNTPGAALDIVTAGTALNIRAGAAVFSNAAVGAGGGTPVVIPANTTAVTVTNDGVAFPINLVPPVGVPGQILIIFNNDPDAVVAPFPIASGQARMYIHLGGAWRLVN